MRYVDGFVLPMPKRRVEAYLRMAKKAGKIWKQHGALEYFECAGDDLKVKGMLPFPKLCRLKPGETVFFSFIVYRSRGHRDRVNAKVMKDPRIAKLAQEMVAIDMKRMAYGGFKARVVL